MTVREILLLGNPLLLKVCAPVAHADLPQMEPVIADLHDTLLDFRARYGAGRAIAAPQIGVLKRLVVMDIDRLVVFFNPVLDQCSDEMFTLWDDCMSFPDLLVRVRRHTSCRVTYHDQDWAEQQMSLEGDLSELLQHECDHLDGVLAVARAIDGASFCLRSERQHIVE